MEEQRQQFKLKTQNLLKFAEEPPEPKARSGGPGRKKKDRSGDIYSEGEGDGENQPLSKKKRRGRKRAAAAGGEGEGEGKKRKRRRKEGGGEKKERKKRCVHYSYNIMNHEKVDIIAHSIKKSDISLATLLRYCSV